jgi:CheY-like chemotaxis protein
MLKLPSVLLIDDDTTTNFLNSLLINTMAIAEQVLVAENGEEALRLLAPGQPSPTLILLDMNMPVMNGLAFLESYAQLPQPWASIIVLLTTSVHERDLARAQQLPIAQALDKPLTKDKLLGVLRQHFPQAVPALPHILNEFSIDTGT